MEVDLPDGKYVLAVSGGVDSMVLLDVLRKKPGVEIVVAHFNHGIRKDSAKDERLVGKAANKYGLKLEIGRAELGTNASEDAARQARYRFLESVKKKHGAEAIVTAHHQDDLIETAFLNLLRGTGRRGVIAIMANPDIVRPLLGVPKADILKYARRSGIDWVEDESNLDTKYLRNYIRRNIMPKLTDSDRRKILSSIKNVAKNSAETEALLSDITNGLGGSSTLSRAEFINLPSEVASEVVMHILRRGGQRQFDKKTIERLVVAIKTAQPDTKHDIARGKWLHIGADTASFELGG